MFRKGRLGAKKEGEAPLKGWWGRAARGRPELCGAMRARVRNKKTLEVAIMVLVVFVGILSSSCWRTGSSSASSSESSSSSSSSSSTMRQALPAPMSLVC